MPRILGFDGERVKHLCKSGQLSSCTDRQVYMCIIACIQD